MPAEGAYLHAVPPLADPEPAQREALLIHRIGEGARGDAVGELYDRYARRIFALGLSALGDRGLAEEVVQETFVRIWRAAGRYDPKRGAPASWIFTIARRVAIDLHRRAPCTIAGEAPDAGALDANLEGLVLELTVRDALDALGEQQREILELAYRQGLSQSEVAARLGIPLGTVKSRTFHALRALHAALTERGIDG